MQELVQKPGPEEEKFLAWHAKAKEDGLVDFHCFWNPNSQINQDREVYFKAINDVLEKEAAGDFKVLIRVEVNENGEIIHSEGSL